MSTDNTATTEATTVTESVALTSEQASHATSDWGEINRELLARRLRTTFLTTSPFHDERDRMPEEIEQQWINVANDAIAALLEGDPE